MQPETPEPAKEGHVVFLLLPFCLIVILCYLPVGLAFGALPSHVHNSLGFGASIVGWTIGLQSIATVLTRGIAGNITDGTGARRSIFFGFGALALSSCLTLSASLMFFSPSESLALILVGRLVLGLAESLVMAGCLAASIAAVGPKRAGLAMVWVGIALFVGIAAGVPAGEAAYAAFGLMGIGVVSLVAAFLVAILSVFVKHTVNPHAKRKSFLQIVGLIWPYGMALGLSTIGYGAMISFLALFYQSRGWEGAATCIAIFSLVYILTRVLFGSLPDKVGGFKIAIFTLPLEFAGFGLVGFANSPTMVLAGAVLAGIGYSLTFPALGVEMVKTIPPQSRGSAMGGYVAFIDIGLGVTGPIGGALVAKTGFPSLFGLSAVTCIVALIIMIVVHKISEKQQA